jgi:hypothetical protein
MGDYEVSPLNAAAAPPMKAMTTTAPPPMSMASLNAYETQAPATVNAAVSAANGNRFFIHFSLVEILAASYM